MITLTRTGKYRITQRKKLGQILDKHYGIIFHNLQMHVESLTVRLQNANVYIAERLAKLNTSYKVPIYVAESQPSCW